MLEVRLLGDLSVRRPDGTEVDDGAWQTGGARDLLRLLALPAGRPVRSGMLIDQLWPGSGTTEGRSRLRATAAEVRRTVGGDCIGREPGRMFLRWPWVDVALVRALLVAGAAAAAAGRTEDVVARARSVENLYTGDFRADDDGSDWALAVREDLAQGRRALLADAAAGCLALGRHREAIGYAEALQRADPTSERAHLVRMEAHAALGEVDRALTAFERYRGGLRRHGGPASV